MPGLSIEKRFPKPGEFANDADEARQRVVAGATTPGL